MDQSEEFDPDTRAGIEAVQMLKAGAISWSNWRLKNGNGHINLRGADLSNQEWASYNFRDVDFTGANLASGDFSHSEFDEQTNFRSANLTEALIAIDSIKSHNKIDIRLDDPDDVKNPFRAQKNTQTNDIDQAGADNKHVPEEDAIKSLQGLLIQVDEKTAILQDIFNKADTRLSRSETTQRSFADTVDKAKKLTTNLEDTQARIESIFEDEQKQAFDSFLIKVRPELQAAKAEVKVDGIVGTAYQAWAKKQRNHWIAFGTGTAIFAASIIGLLIATVLYQADILGFIKSVSVIEAIDEGGKTISMTSIFGRLAAITIPVAAIAWLLRLVSRFTLQNLSLANDAGIRKVSIDTYSKLVGTPGALDEKDKAIMLNAIFRPLPGGSEADIAPPNLLDFVGKKGS